MTLSASLFVKQLIEEAGIVPGVPEVDWKPLPPWSLPGVPRKGEFMFIQEGGVDSPVRKYIVERVDWVLRIYAPEGHRDMPHVEIFLEKAD